jgi:hypothetical protein
MSTPMMIGLNVWEYNTDDSFHDWSGVVPDTDMASGRCGSRIRYTVSLLRCTIEAT